MQNAEYLKLKGIIMRLLQTFHHSPPGLRSHTPGLTTFTYGVITSKRPPPVIAYVLTVPLETAGKSTVLLLYHIIPHLLPLYVQDLCTGLGSFDVTNNLQWILT